MSDYILIQINCDHCGVEFYISKLYLSKTYTQTKNKDDYAYIKCITKGCDCEFLLKGYKNKPQDDYCWDTGKIIKKEN